MRPNVFHLTIGGHPYCTWLGCGAGQDIALQSKVTSCTQMSEALATDAVRRLTPYFRAGAVACVEGECPIADAKEEPPTRMAGAAVLATAYAAGVDMDDAAVLRMVGDWLDQHADPTLAFDLAGFMAKALQAHKDAMA